MAVFIRQIDYLKKLDLEDINKMVEQLNRALYELNRKKVNISGVT